MCTRRLVVAALRVAGLDPHERAIAEHGGANVPATIPGQIDRWVPVAAQCDHVGVLSRGADDNASAVATSGRRCSGPHSSAV